MWPLGSLWGSGSAVGTLLLLYLSPPPFALFKINDLEMEQMVRQTTFSGLPCWAGLHGCKVASQRRRGGGHFSLGALLDDKERKEKEGNLSFYLLFNSVGTC